MKRVVFLLPLLLLSGCGEMIFSRHVGAPGPSPLGTQGFAMVDTHYDLPVYRDWPEKPYEVIGMLRYSHVYPYWSESKIEDAVEAAKKQGGEAIILRQGYQFGPAPTHPPGFVEATALVIRWKR